MNYTLINEHRVVDINDLSLMFVDNVIKSCSCGICTV